MRRMSWSRLVAALAVLLCGSGPAPAQVKLQLGDQFLPFFPGLFAYDRDRGSSFSRDVFFNYGVTTKVVFPAMDILPHDDSPDVKRRVRLTLSDNDPLQNPSGDIEVFGTVYERNQANPSFPPSSMAVSEVLHFSSNGTLTTSTYFDLVTSIETAGLGMNATLEAEFWDGHEQEMIVGATIEGVTDSLQCEQDWVVYFNGQASVPDWDPLAASCRAALIPGAYLQNGLAVSSSVYRGMYFGIDPDEDEEDTFFHFREDGHTSPPTKWEDWIASLPYGGYFFDVDSTNDPQVRPIVVELERKSDLQIVDTARFLLTVAVNPFGQPSLVAMTSETECPGAIAQLSERGLDRLEPTHAATLPYPIVPGGKQPRLSQSAIAMQEHTSPSVTVDLDALPPADRDYWTKPNPAPRPNEGEFAGYLAYKAILKDAQRKHTRFRIAINLCKGAPNPAACDAAVRLNHCVDSKPGLSNFRLRIDGVSTYFDPARPDDALTIGDVTDMDLSFGQNQILADFILEDIQGWLEASIDPASIRIEWDRPLGDPCTIKPGDRVLSDFTAGSVDYQDWLICRDLSFTAASGSLADPVVFDVVANEELIDTPFGALAPDVSLADLGADHGLGICEQGWLSTLIEDEILAWEAGVADTIEQELVTSPGEDEALNRLLSPYELGVASVDDPPPGTPPYDVHPLGFYELSATIGKTDADDHGAQCDAIDGLYVPYLTRSSPINALPFLTWFCPVASGQTCDGLAGYHEPMLEAGLDPNGDPFDVALNYTTAHINHSLWAQARRSERLGSPAFPARLDIGPTAIVEQATELGHDDVVSALSAVGSSFGLRYHQEGAPFATITDGVGFDPPKLIYVTPNVVIELVSFADDGTENVVAKFLVDVIDRDLQLSFREGGVPSLKAEWGELAILSLTSTFAPECYDTFAVGSCDEHLRTVIGALLRPTLEATVLEMIETAPALQLFDSGQESSKPRHLKNPRTFLLNQGVALVADLCNPAADDCE